MKLLIQSLTVLVLLTGCLWAWHRYSVPPVPLPPAPTTYFAGVWMFSEICEPISKAIPDAEIANDGVVFLPARTIYLDAPICEFGGSKWIFGQGADKTVLIEKPK